MGDAMNSPSKKETAEPSTSLPQGRFAQDYNLFLLVWFPDVGVGLGQADVGEDAVDELTGHFC